MPTRDSNTPKEPRIQARVSEEVYTTIQKAAELQGLTLAAFATSATYEKAHQVIKDHEVLALNAEDAQRFAEALINPPEPNDALKRAAKRRAEMIQQ